MLKLQSCVYEPYYKLINLYQLNRLKVDITVISQKMQRMSEHWGFSITNALIQEH